MTSVVDIANKSLQAIGLQKKISSLAQDSAEAQAINLIIDDLRQDLLRMAPWNFALKTANLQYITSAPGTPENVSAATTLWQPGQPPPPWAYEYQYPVDCLRLCWVIPATQTGFAGGVPITTAVTGGAASFWQGPPVRFKVQNDTFYGAISAAVLFGGLNYAVGDQITLNIGPNTSPPIGAPAVLQVAAESGGVITAVSIVSSIPGESQSGAYFGGPGSNINPASQGSTTGVGSGATFQLTFTNVAGPQQVILTNQEFATSTYVQNIIDPNIMHSDFQRAWINLIGAHVIFSLQQNAQLANLLISKVNSSIAQARVADGNEGMTINDVTPDWLRIRGIDFATAYSGPYTGYDWGGLWPAYG